MCKARIVRCRCMHEAALLGVDPTFLAASGNGTWHIDKPANQAHSKILTHKIVSEKLFFFKLLSFRDNFFKFYFIFKLYNIVFVCTKDLRKNICVRKEMLISNFLTFFSPKKNGFKSRRALKMLAKG